MTCSMLSSHFMLSTNTQNWLQWVVEVSVSNSAEHCNLSGLKVKRYYAFVLGEFLIRSCSCYFQHLWFCLQRTLIDILYSKCFHIVNIWLNILNMVNSFQITNMYMARTKTLHKHSSNCRQEQLSHTMCYELFSCHTYRDIAESLSQLAAQA